MSIVHDPGASDLRRAAAELATRIPGPLAPFTELAYNYRWSWWPGGPDLFRDIDPYRWELCGGNPVRLLEEVSAATVRRAAENYELIARADGIAQRIRAELMRKDESSPRIAFFCAEFGVHQSLPVYSGGLGVLAGDILKEASDSKLNMVAVGIMYRRGYFHQRVDAAGQQHEYWLDSDAQRLPAARVTGPDGRPLQVALDLFGRTVHVQIWRVSVGRIPLYLLDTDIPVNARVDRWITSRLYEGARDIRLAQYAVLGVGGVRALRAMGIQPDVLHLNEGHAALAPVELERCGAGVRTVFTTHTPVAAGNETYSSDEVRAAFSGLLGDSETLLRRGRVDPDNGGEPFGMTVLGLRSSAFRNGVSGRHGSVARGMWRGVFNADNDDAVPIHHVTNGVHIPTWMAAPMREMLSRHLGDGWESHAADPRTWDAVDTIPDGEIWNVRNTLRARLVDFVRERAVLDRMSRGEPTPYVQAAERAFAPDILTVGFARRLVAYKRLHLLAYDPDRALKLFGSPLQVVIAGKAHPQDEEAKGILRTLFGLKHAPQVAERVAYLENYEIGLAMHLVAGCDVWMNLPRPPMEASGTSGMKSALNGGINLSVLDGWYEEGWDGSNGWAIPSDSHASHEDQDRHDANALYDLLEREVVPLFYERVDGVPVGWVRMMKHSLRTIGPRFSSARMVGDYAARAYIG